MTRGVEGFGLVEDLRVDPRTRDVPLVVFSAKDISSSRAEI
jgi:CheY-like chemotaxis protein